MRGLALWRDHLYFNEGGHVIRTLRFIVIGRDIAPDPNCDFTGLFPGKEDSVRVEFIFSKEWREIPKVAGFFSIMGNEYEPQVIENDACMIPTEALKCPSFKMRIFGKRRNLITKTDEITIRQGGKK